MKPRPLLCLAILLLALTACQAAEPPAPTSTATLPPTHTSAPTATATLKPSPLPPAATTTPSPVPSNTPKPTPTAMNIPDYQRICPNVDEMLLSDLNAKGYILLETGGLLYAFDTSSGEITPLPDITDYGFAPVSPDGKWLAHRVEDANGSPMLEVRPINGPPIFSIPYGETWVDLYWLDRERIVATYWRGTGDDWVSNYGDAIINVFTGQITELYAERFDGFGMPGISPLFDLSLTRVVYTRYGPYGEVSLVLWNLETSTFLWEMDIGDQLCYLRPAWSPDGTRFVVGSPADRHAFYPPYELFLVDRDGQVTQLTHFTEANLHKITMTYPQWSPDGRYIAFWFMDALAVYDTTTGMITDFCMPKNYFYENQIIWSPDSRQIVINSDVVLHEGPTRVIVVDVTSNKAIEIPGDYRALGWMVEEP